MAKNWISRLIKWWIELIRESTSVLFFSRRWYLGNWKTSRDVNSMICCVGINITALFTRKVPNSSRLATKQTKSQEHKAGRYWNNLKDKWNLINEMEWALRFPEKRKVFLKEKVAVKISIKKKKKSQFMSNCHNIYCT